MVLQGVVACDPLFQLLEVVVEFVVVVVVVAVVVVVVVAVVVVVVVIWVGRLWLDHSTLLSRISGKYFSLHNLTIPRKLFVAEQRSFKKLS